MNQNALDLKPRANFWQSALAVTLAFVALKLALHFTFNSNYGYFRDELYFLACAEHLAWGYPDHAPLVVWTTKISRALLGDSLFAIRFLSAVAGATKILLTGLLVKEFGGGRFAAFLACLCVLLAPVYLTIDNLLAMNSFEPVFWMSCVYFAVLAVKRDNQKYWLGFGIFAGLGLMNKHSMLFFGAAIVVGLLLTPARKAFLSKCLYLGGALAFLIFLPNIIWQIQNDFATLELLQNVQKTGKNVVLSPPAFIFQQIMMMLPTTLLVWLAGLWWLLAGKGKQFRFLGAAYLVLLALMIYLKAKDYYLSPIYPMLFAAGAVWWEEIVRQFRPLGFGKVVLPILIIGMGLLALPMAVPVLPVEKLIQYQEMTGIKPPKTEVGHEGVLQQVYGDQFGWREMVEKTAEVYHSLPPEEREKAAIFGSNYGEAGAIDFFGPRYGLPKAISPHQSYFLWGPRNYTGEVVILLGTRKREDAEKNCRSVEEKAEVNHPYSMAEEKYKILVCRQTRKPLPEIWVSLKHWN